MRNAQRLGAYWIAAASLAIGGLLGPAWVHGASNRFEETVEVVTVEVPVQVIANGKPVRGLSAESFEILANGKRQAITGFDVIDLAEIADDPSSTDLPLPARRHFLMLFDLSFSQPDGVVKARNAAKELVRGSLHSTDLVAVGTYSLNQGPKLVLGFTPDREQLETALDQLGLQQYNQRFSDPLGLVAAFDPVQRSASDASAQGNTNRRAGIDVDALFRQHLADISVATARVAREEQVDRARAYTSSFEELAELLREVRGRKQVVLFSEGFDTTAILGSDSSQRATENARAVERGEYWRVDSDERFGSGSTLAFLGKMLEAFRRADAVIQAVDVGGARTSARAETASETSGLITTTAGQGLVSRSENSLFVMADGTGGELYRNYNDLDQAISQLLDRTSVTYVLSFTPKKLPPADSFQRIQVKLKGAGRGARAIHRPGFYAPTPYRDQTALVRQLKAADLVLDTTEGGEIELTAWAVPNGRPAPGAQDGRSEVLLFLDVDGESLLQQQERDIARFRVFAYAIDEEGSVGDFMTQALTLDLNRVERSILDGDLSFFGRLHMPPGKYRLRVVVQDARSGRHGARTSRLMVPSLGTDMPALAPPLFAMTQDQGLLLNEDDSRQEAREYPLREGDIAFVARSRIVLDQDTVPVVVNAFASTSAELEAWLEGPSGQRLERGIVIARALAPGEDDSLRAELTLDPSAISRGNYTLGLRVKDGDRTATQRVAVVVGEADTKQR